MGKNYIYNWNCVHVSLNIEDPNVEEQYTQMMDGTPLISRSSNRSIVRSGSKVSSDIQIMDYRLEDGLERLDGSVGSSLDARDS